MILGHYRKRPAEVWLYGIDLTDWLVGSDNISNATASAACLSTPGTVTLSILATSHANHEVTVKVSGGTAGEVYKVTVLATSHDGLINESEFLLSVEAV